MSTYRLERSLHDAYLRERFRPGTSSGLSGAGFYNPILKYVSKTHYPKICGALKSFSSFLSFVPSTLFLIFAAPRVFRLLHKQRKLLPLRQLPLVGNVVVASRAILSACVAGSSLAMWVVWQQTDDLHGEWSGWASCAASSLAALVLVSLVLLEHFRCNRSSQLPALYLLVNCLLIAQRLRTFASVSPPVSIPLIANLSSTFILFLALQISIRSSVINGSSLPPSATSGLVSRYFIAWVLPLLWRGYRRPLSMKHLGSIDNSLHSLNTWDEFEPAWRRQQSRFAAGMTKQPLFWACTMAFPAKLAAPLLPCLIYSITSLARPLIVLHTINFVTSYSTEYPDQLADGWGLVGAAFLTYIVYALSQAIAHVAMQRSSLALRGALMEALYRKSLVIKVDTAREMGASKVGNLMSVDVQAVVQNVESIHSTWTALVMTALGLYIIWTQIGLSFLASVGGAIIFFAALPLLTSHISDTRSAWARSTDSRVKYISSVLRHIKSLKLSAYESIVHARACTMREAEIFALISWIKEILKVSIATNWLGNFLSLVTIVVYTVVSLYAKDGANSVTTAKIFTITSTITLISTPLLMLGQRLGSIVSAWASVKRIEEFLLQEEKPSLSSVKEGSHEFGEQTIVLNQATFGLKSDVPLLHKLDVTLAKPRMWAIIGRVGCGKSSLLQALLGDVDLLSGESTIELGTIGYCSQDPWLRTNSSIRENVIFIRPYEAKWYWTVVKAVGLDVDLLSMANGDASVVSNLSGGQKQRVALARAIYGKFDTYILDDVFSALDVDTENKAFAALFGAQGLLSDKCVIMTTNHVHRLAHASHISVMAEGSIVEQGSYEQLNSVEDGEMARLVQEFANGKKGKEKVEVADILSESQEDTSRSEKAPSDIVEEGRKGSVAWGTYYMYLKAMGFTNATIWIVITVIVAAVETCINVYLQAWTTTLAGSRRSRYGEFLGGYAGLQLGYLLAFSGAIINAFMVAHPQASRQLHKWMLAGLLQTSLDYFESKPTGQMVNRFNSDLNLIDMKLPNSALNFMFATTQIFGGMILIVVAASYMAAVLVGVLVAMVFLQRFYVRAARELRRLDLTSRSPIYTLFSETVDVDGLRTIRAMQAEETCRQLMTVRVTASQHPAWLLMAIQKWLELALNLCITFVNTLLIVIAVINRHSVSAGILAAALSSAASLNVLLGEAVVEWTEVEMSITSVERVQEYIELPRQEASLGHTSKTSFSLKGSEDPWHPSGGIRFSHVTARYRPTLPPALRDVTFNVKPGQRVGICGRSGSGKSTLLGVMWRLIDCDEGVGKGIFMDGEDIRNVGLTEYRKAMSIIPQDPLLLEVSLRENLDPEGECVDADIWSALQSSQLKEHVELFPNKLDEQIEGGGAKFSRGQRQLLALARAILRQRKILALDEATSSIDARTDLAIQQTIREAFSDCTVLTIAHRITTIIDYDLIVVMNAGAIVEIGPPQNLLAKPNGQFRRMAMESGITPGGTSSWDVHPA